PRSRRSRGGSLAHSRRLRTRRAAKQRPLVAAGRAEGQSRSADASAERLRALLDSAGDSSNDERRRGDDAPLLGSKLAPQSQGLLPSIPELIRTERVPRTTATATVVAATSTPRVPRRSPPFPRRRKPGVSRS